MTQGDDSAEQGPVPNQQDRRRAAETFFRKAFTCVLVWAIFWALLAAASGAGLAGSVSLEKPPPGGPTIHWGALDRLAEGFSWEKPRLVQLGGSLFGIAGLWGCAAVITFPRRFGDMTALIELTGHTEWVAACESAARWLIAGLVGFIIAPVCSIVLAGIFDMNETAVGNTLGWCFALMASWLAVSLSVWHLRIGQLCGMAAASCGQRQLEGRVKQVVQNWRILVAEVVGFPFIGYFLLVRLGDPKWFWLLAVIFELFFVYCLVYLLFLVRMTAEALSGGAANGGKAAERGLPPPPGGRGA